MIDIHCHLCFPGAYKNVNQVVLRAKKEMLGIITSSARYGEGLRVLELAEKNKGFVFPTLGYHPTEGTDHEGVLKLIEENRDKIVGVGECGLDYHWEKDPGKREEQKKIFQKFIDITKKTNIPLVIHSWDAEQECFDMVRDSGVRCVFHCYSGSKELAQEILDSGFWISVSTQVCFSKNHRKLVKLIPLEKVLLETDAPWLSPNKPEPNYPWNIKISAEKIADIKKVSKEEVLEYARKNAIKFFSLDI
ncbi:MAG: TatD family hydrolase [Candidatus Aenigmatarchaeota archaeon]|nr:MAG: TatD family hydrolase [Candidatus Aenigmarchaeota archaeon]